MPSSAFIILPALALISIPLVISAYITIIFSFLALWLRLSVVYIELCYAIITNFFVIPTSSDSLLTFISSEPASPLSTSFRSTSTLNGPSTSPSSSRRSARPRAQRYNSSTSLDTFINHRIPQNPFSSLISGDQARDFEDMGGWRCLAPRSQDQNQNQNRDSSNSPPSSPNQASINGAETAEERAWLSINHRLELPSHILTLSEPASWGLSAPLLPANTMSPQRRRNHKRSVTTSMLSFSRGGGGGGLSLSLSNRPETPSAPATPAAHYSRLSQSALVGSSDGYFPLQGCTTNERQMSGTTTPRTAASIEDRSAGLGLGRFMAHYPAGVRHRRRSVSGALRPFGRD